MSNILVNGLKSKAGGGKNILENYLRILLTTPGEHTYYVLTPDRTTYEGYSTSSVHILDETELLKSNILFPLLYFYQLPMLLRKYKIDLIFNFGDVIIPSRTKQVYFFDWAYAVYPEPYIWKGMGLKDKLLRKMKVFLIRKYIKDVILTIAQTRNMVSRLKRYYSLDKVVVVPTPVGINYNHADHSLDYNLPTEKTKFLYPASFATHKNFEFVLSVAELIKTNRLPYVIVLTLDKSEAVEFLEKIEQNELNSIINIGKQQSADMPCLYNQCDVLFMPTLLESFGLPYIEAMAHGLPIITSDLDFAHEMCGELAIYFDPFDPNTGLFAMQEATNTTDRIEERIKSGKEKIAALPDWPETFIRIQNLLDDSLQKQ